MVSPEQRMERVKRSEKSRRADVLNHLEGVWQDEVGVLPSEGRNHLRATLGQWLELGSAPVIEAMNQALDSTPSHDVDEVFAQMRLRLKPRFRGLLRARLARAA